MTTPKASRIWASTLDLLEKLAREQARYEALASAAEGLLDALAGTNKIEVTVAAAEYKLRNALREGDK